VPTSEVDFQGYVVRVGRDGPKTYYKTIDWLALYSSTQFKNGSNVVICLRSKEYVETKILK